jgi:hypothetical protein
MTSYPVRTAVGPLGSSVKTSCLLPLLAKPGRPGRYASVVRYKIIRCILQLGAGLYNISEPRRSIAPTYRVGDRAPKLQMKLCPHGRVILPPAG